MKAYHGGHARGGSYTRTPISATA